MLTIPIPKWGLPEMIHGMQNVINICHKFVSMEEIEHNGTAGLTVTTKQNFQKSFQQ
jgi:hypothetical protein